jgi:hypothetical protein
MNLTTHRPDYSSKEWAETPADQRLMIDLKITTFASAPEKGIVQWFAEQAPRFGMRAGGFKAQFYAWRETRDWRVLADKRVAKIARPEEATTRVPRFRAYLLTLVESYQRKNLPAFRELRRRWRVRDQAIPGYEGFPGWPELPAGWKNRNLADIVKAETNKARMQSIRIGTSSKTNPYLPGVLTTRVGLWPGAVIQLDDVWHDNYVSHGKKREIVRVLELGALDLFSGHRFHWGAKPRRRRENGTWETLAGKDMRLFMAGLLHRFGTCPQGMMFLSEHQTAKVDETVRRTLYDATAGKVRVDYQPIEKHSALTNYWGGTEGGNYRAKACLESTHALMHNDLAALAMQAGSPSSGLKAPVTTDRQLAYIAKMLLKVADKVPHRLDLLRLPVMDFHREFIPFLTDYYLFGLALRTDHELEGWHELGHVITEYTALPGSGTYFDEGGFLALPAVSQAIIREAARQAPDQWTRERRLSPLEVFAKKPKWDPVPATVLCDIAGADLARECTARKGFITFSDSEISADPLIYKARYTSGPRAGHEIGHGETVNLVVFPFDDAAPAIAIDAKGRVLGELSLYKRVLSVDPTAFDTTAPYDIRPDIRSQDLKRAAGEKHQRTADIMEPLRIHHAERVQDARDLREHNARIADPDFPITDEEIAAHRAFHGTPAQKAADTRRGTRVARTAAALDTDDALDAWSNPATTTAADLQSSGPEDFDPFA